MKLLENVIRASLLAGGMLVSALLVSCGGGDLVEKFAPTRLLVFGDETSVIEDDNNDANGRKYTVNALATDNVTLDCSSNPIWIQYVSASFSLVLPECNPTGVADPKSRIYANAGDNVADVTAQIDSHLLADTFSGTDLVTVLAGANDILEQYALYDGSNAATLTAAVEAAGKALAAQVNRIAAAGGKVLVATVPDLGLSAFAITENTANAGRAALLSGLTSAFNVQVRAGIVNNGRKIGLLLADEQVQLLSKFPGTYGLVNVTTAVCDPAKAASVQVCTSQTLVTDGSAATFLWADGTHLSPGGHKSLGQAAASRATNNPF
jgi:lysophospholipase L1-like esterase